MKQYIKALEHILENGKQRGDRTGIGTKGVLGIRCVLILETAFPL